jgi:NADH-quinone oxidoreductase subunit L
VSQLGFMFVAAGTGNWTAAIFHLGTHAFFKACLFLGAGSVMHAMEHEGSTTPGDIMTMGGLSRRLKLTHGTFLVSCLAIAGIVPFSGFFSKDEILGGAFAVHPPGWPDWYGKLLWAGLLIAALGTAFYMWRLYFLVFRGEPRSDAAKHAHESPPSMTGPLVILAGFATVIGFLGLPHLELHLPSFTHALAHWLEPSLTESWYQAGRAGEQAIAGYLSDGTTIGLMVVALAVGVTGIGGAFLFYGRGPSKTVATLVDGPLGPLYRASKAKLWFDEVYDVIFVQPFKQLARGLFEIVDRFVIDTVAVNGSAFVVGIFGRISRWFQNGNVQRYLVGVVIGGAVVFVMTDCHHKATFHYTVNGNEVHLQADPGDGLEAATARVYWDLDGDGKKDLDPDDPEKQKLLEKRDVTLTGYAGSVTMWVEDPITHTETKVQQTINLNVWQPESKGAN